MQQFKIKTIIIKIIYLLLITSMNNYASSEMASKLTVVYAHGFGGSKTGRITYIDGYDHTMSLLQTTGCLQKKKFLSIFDRSIHDVTAFNFTDIEINRGANGSIPNPMITHLAQQRDIEQLFNHIEQLNTTECIGFGISRGAATWLTTLGTKKISKKIKAVILESPFAHVECLFSYMILKSAIAFINTIIPIADQNATSAAVFNSIFQEHNPNGIQPILVAENIDKNIPIMLVHSKEDEIIPINHSRELYIKLHESGHSEVYLVELEKGSHTNLLYDPDGIFYKNAVHAFYKKYGLPYDNDSAANVDIKLFQPSIDNVKKKINEPTNKNNHQALNKAVFTQNNGFDLVCW